MARASSHHPVLSRVVSSALAGLVSSSALLAHPLDANASTIRISVTYAGAEADDESLAPALSADGRHVAFVSAATNLVSGDTNNLSDVFVLDRVEGTLVRATVSCASAQAQGESWAPSISGCGRYVAFASEAWNLVGGDSNEVADVFVRDLLLGTTVRVSVSTSGGEADAASTNPVLSADGRFVAFESRSPMLVAGDGNTACDVFVRDLQLGTTERVSVATGGAEANGTSQAPAISADGRFIAFASTASDLAGGGDGNGAWDVFVRDRSLGTTVRVSLTSSGASGDGPSYASSISGCGRYVAFESQASNLVSGDTNGRSDVFFRDLVSGATSRVSVGTGAMQAGGPSGRPSLSACGRWIAFRSEAADLVAGDENDAPDVFVHDREQGTTVRLSVSSAGAPGLGGSSWPALSGNGRFAAFPYAGADLVAGDTNERGDVLLRGPLL